MKCALDRAFWVYYDDKAHMDQMVKTALSLDRSWKDSMNKYLQIYKEAIEK